jgi:hypothetical protein
MISNINVDYTDMQAHIYYRHLYMAVTPWLTWMKEGETVADY